MNTSSMSLKNRINYDLKLNNDNTNVKDLLSPASSQKTPDTLTVLSKQ